MKRTLVVLFIVTFFSSLCFAQQASIPVSQTAPTPVETKTFTGKVSYVSAGGSSRSSGAFGKKGSRGGNKKEKSKGKKPGSITLMDENGEKQNFRVKIECLITNKKGKVLKLNQIREGDKVIVAYITDAKKGTQEAVIIKLLESISMLSRIKKFVGL